ncbi:AAA family ATPase [Nonomuraea sp. PA05]|uniref:AAA family ATPase n=1 Tax=Nonomuraea sp. PA05 TaxID=2604466 RepID=UPI0011DA110D|nr:AAA family ATPase [Nonomuraea sp. PA05]TYB62787.1 AAA family ATPase [Nonomuraea sp. PA05]
MLVWINGTFGVGKTQTAYELHRRLPGSVVCDPEYVGMGLHKMTPPALRTDFQLHPAWRQGVFEVLDLVLSKHEGVVIAPMTLTEPAYHDEILGRLGESGHDVRHFALLAGRETVLARLRERSLSRSLKREAFAVAKLDGCLERLRTPKFAEHVETDRLTVPQVAERIAGAAGLSLTPDGDGPLRHRLRRIGVTLRHIRF